MVEPTVPKNSPLGLCKDRPWTRFFSESENSSITIQVLLDSKGLESLGGSILTFAEYADSIFQLESNVLSNLWRGNMHILI